MAMKDRKTLKEYFKNGNIPSEGNFENMIDSFINKIDDGFSKTTEEGLMIAGPGNSGNLLSFYEEISEENKAEWVLRMNKKGEHKEDRNELQLIDSSGENNKPLMTFSKTGSVGVNGWIYSKGRAGTLQDTIDADGKWHPIIKGLTNCQAFEVVARTGIKETGKHGILHAIAISAFGSRSKIRKTRGCYNFWKPVKIQLRWRGSIKSYQLEMRCKQKLKNTKVKYYITQLWSDEEMGLKEQF